MQVGIIDRRSHMYHSSCGPKTCAQILGSREQAGHAGNKNLIPQAHHVLQVQEETELLRNCSCVEKGVIISSCDKIYRERDRKPEKRIGEEELARFAPLLCRVVERILEEVGRR